MSMEISNSYQARYLNNNLITIILQFNSAEFYCLISFKLINGYITYFKFNAFFECIEFPHILFKKFSFNKMGSQWILPHPR